jgi:hypothetical protein
MVPGMGVGVTELSRAGRFLIVANAGGLLSRTTHPYVGLRGLWRAKDVQREFGTAPVGRAACGRDRRPLHGRGFRTGW